MTDGTIFNKEGQDQKPAENQNTDQQTSSSAGSSQQGTSQVDYNAVFGDKLSSITNDNGEQKYSDVMTALEALKASQDYIKTLEGENKQLKDTSTKTETYEELLRRLDANATNTNQGQQNQQTREIDVEELRKIAREENLAVTREQQKANNQKQVSDVLVSKFGSEEKALEAFNSKAQELEVDAKFLTELAATSPKAVLNYFGTSNTSNTMNKNVQGSVNTDPFNSKTSNNTDKPRIGGVMFGATSSEMKSAWKAAGEAVLSEMETNN